MNSDQIQKAISDTTEGHIVLPDWAALLFLLVLFASAIFIKSYLAKRANTYATKQDLEEITRQMKYSTQITEEIKAKVGHEVWNYQQQWELKKSLYEPLLENLFVLQSTLLDLISFEYGKKLSETEEKYRKELEIKRALTKENIKKVAGKASIIFPQETMVAFQNMYGDLMRTPNQHLEHDWDDADAELAQVEGAYEFFVKVAKEDLGL